MSLVSSIAIRAVASGGGRWRRHVGGGRSSSGSVFFGLGLATTATLATTTTSCDAGGGGAASPSATTGLVSRSEQVSRLRSSSSVEDPYDILVVGGGATGAGCALDAATRIQDGEGDDDRPRKLRVACIDRGDFGGETSSRSTKLIWAGLKYMGAAFAAVLSPRLVTHPVETTTRFVDEMRMVRNCHAERRYMTEQQAHLCRWIPIAVPLSSWLYLHPPPLSHALFGFFPLLAPLVLKVYDGLSWFSGPSSYVLGPTRARECLPQLRHHDLAYCAVFYEAQHNDARTNLAIALSAAQHGAHIANHVEMTRVLFSSNAEDQGTAVGIRARDCLSQEEFDIYAKRIIFAGGPFTDSLRRMEHFETKNGSFPKAVAAAAGTHIVLPGRYCPRDMGLLDICTSDGRFLFILPWQGHTLVGTTDQKCEARSSPTAPEEEIQWLLRECTTYWECRSVPRSDVLSSWRGWRPLAVDPHQAKVGGGQVSRDHVISRNPETGIYFIAGGKWTTWREMAEDAVTTVLAGGKQDDKKKKKMTTTIPPSRTLQLKLHGGEGYETDLSEQLMQRYPNQLASSREVADHLVETYGGCCWRVCQLWEEENPDWANRITPYFPYVRAEVIYACRWECACRLSDVMSLRTRMAPLNRQEALRAIPVVAQLMAHELGWNAARTAQEIQDAQAHVQAYIGPTPQQSSTQ